MSEDPNNSQQEQEGKKTENQEQKTQNQQSDKDKNFEALRKAKEASDAELAKYKAKEAEAEKKKLAEEGKYQELIEKERKEKEELLTKYQSEKRQTILEKELAKSGINPELVDLAVSAVQNQVKFNDDNQPENLAEIVESLKTNKPSLFSDPKVTTAGKIGAGVSTSGDPKMTKEKALEIINSGDNRLYNSNLKAIQEALK